jgi:hypothetical protein
MPNNYQAGLEELLKLLNDRPDILKELIFEPNNTQNLVDHLKSETARAMVSKPVQDFLNYVADSHDGYPIAQCFRETYHLCGKGTWIGLCGGGTTYDSEDRPAPEAKPRAPKAKPRR